MTEPYVPSLPVEFIGSLVDSGRWREVGISHWHLLREEAPITRRGRANEERFDTARIAAAVRSCRKVSTDPHDVITWIWRQKIDGVLSGANPARYAAQAGWHAEKDLLFAIEVCWEFLTERLSAKHLGPSGGGVEIRPNLSLDVHAYPQTAETCRRH